MSAHGVVIILSCFSKTFLLVCMSTVNIFIRAVTVADFYHRSGNGPTTAGGAVL